METKMVIAVRTDLHMNVGKIAAQVAHAASLFLLRRLSKPVGENDLQISPPFTDEQIDWLMRDPEIPHWGFGGMTKVVVQVASLFELEGLIVSALERVECHTVTDRTLGVPTCTAFGPDKVDKVDAITGHLPLLKKISR